MKKSGKEKNYYCGMGEVPRGKTRAPPEYCLQNKLVRYYGVVAIDPKLLEAYKKPSSDIQSEKLKLKNIEYQAKLLIKEISMCKLIIDNGKFSKQKTQNAQKKLATLIGKKNKLKEKLLKQSKYVKHLEKEESRYLDSLQENSDEETDDGNNTSDDENNTSDDENNTSNNKKISSDNEKDDTESDISDEESDKFGKEKHDSDDENSEISSDSCDESDESDESDKFGKEKHDSDDENSEISSDSCDEKYSSEND